MADTTTSVADTQGMDEETRKFAFNFFTFDAESGKLFHSQDRCSSSFKREASYKQYLVRDAGNEAGNVNPKDGYRYVRLLGKSVSAHRIVWLMLYGSMPEFIDHIDGNRDNNTPSNLRNVSRKENNKNKCMPINNKSGVIGVSWKAKNRKWCAQINDIQGRKTHLGLFNTIEAATFARKQAETSFGYHSNHGRA